LLSGAIGLVIYYAYPVAPPRLVPGTDFIDTVLQEYHVRRVLMPPFLTNEYAAVPSLHFGWNLVMGVAIWHAFPNLLARWFSVVMPSLMLIAIVVTANHFILDAAAGVIVVIAGAILAFWARDYGKKHFRGENSLHEGVRWLLGVLSRREQRHGSAVG
jgi:membrane-associated phospholipid phosphatase